MTSHQHEIAHEARLLREQNRVCSLFAQPLTYARHAVVVDGVCYPSVIEASEATGISTKAIYEGIKGKMDAYMGRRFTASWFIEKQDRP